MEKTSEEKRNVRLLRVVTRKGFTRERKTLTSLVNVLDCLRCRHRLERPLVVHSWQLGWIVISTVRDKDEAQHHSICSVTINASMILIETTEAFSP